MRKFLLSLVAIIAGAGLVSAENFTLVMGDQWGTEDCDLTEWTQDGFTFTPAKGENAKDKIPVYKQKNKEVRFYALNTVTITAPADGEPMTQLVFTLSKQGREEQAVVTASVGEVATQTVGNTTITWTGSAHSVTFTVGATNSLHTEDIADGSGQFNFTKVDIATGESTIEKPADTATEFFMCNATDAEGVLSAWTQGNLKFKAEKGADDTANDPALKNGEEARLYVGNVLTITTVDGQDIASLEFVLSAQGLQQQAALTASTGEMAQAQGANIKWTGKASSVTFTVGANEYGTDETKKGQFDFTKIILAYDDPSTEVTSIANANENLPVRYFNLQGVEVANPTTGIYIRRQGNTTTKISIR